MKIELPFYSNLKSDTHCFQAALKIILKHFFPKRNFSYKLLDKLSYHPDRKYWTWSTAGSVSLAKLGLKVNFHSHFDYKEFSKEGEKYIYRVYPKDEYEVVIIGN